MDLSRICTSRACFYSLIVHLLHLWERFFPPCVYVNRCGLKVAGRAWYKQAVIIFLALASGCNDHHQCANVYRFPISFFYDMILPIAKFARNVIFVSFLTVVLPDALQIHISLCTRRLFICALELLRSFPADFLQFLQCGCHQPSAPFLVGLRSAPARLS